MIVRVRESLEASVKMDDAAPASSPVVPRDRQDRPRMEIGAESESRISCLLEEGVEISRDEADTSRAIHPGETQQRTMVIKPSWWLVQDGHYNFTNFASLAPHL